MSRNAVGPRRVGVVGITRTVLPAEMSVDDLLKLAGVMCASNAIDRCLVWLEGALQVAGARNQTHLVDGITEAYKDIVEKVRNQVKTRS